MAASSQPIGFCGLGAMGFGMATNLVKHGYTVKGFDVFPDPLKRFEAQGGTPTSSLKESAEGVAFYVCMVATAAQADQAIFGKDGILEGLQQNATLLLASTVPASYCHELNERLAAVRPDIAFIDCPVSGGAIRAANGTLSIMASSNRPEALSKANFLLAEMSDENKLFIVEGGVGQGSNMKMVHQVLAGIQILSTSEGMGFAANLGLQPEFVIKKVCETEAWSWMFENRTPRMLTEDYYPGASALTIILKDVGIITSSARLVEFPTTLTSIAEQVYTSGLSRGFGPNDDAGMVRIYYPQPVSTVKASADAESKIDLVLTYYRIVHLLAAAESLAFAHRVSLPLPQLLTLANDAAGGSAMFRKFGPQMASILTGDGSSNQSGSNERSVDKLIEELGAVLDAAKQARCPLFLGAAAYDILVGLKNRGYGTVNEGNVVKWWRP